MITKTNLTTGLATASPVSISYREGKFNVWMRVLKNGHLTFLPRKVHYLGTFFITCGEETIIYSLPAAEKEKSLSNFMLRLTKRCNKFQMNELPLQLRSRLAVA